MRDHGEFTLVTHRKKRTSRTRNTSVPIALSVNRCDDAENDSDFNCDIFLGKLLQAEIELRNSSFADQVFCSLKDSLNELRVDGISEIICYGLGHFSSRRTSKYQLALLISLKNQYSSEIYIYDPIFSSKEVQLLQKLGFNVIKLNEEGKRIIRNCVTLVYMPHCSIHLTNNFLYANWSTQLSKCILLTNSFSIVADDSKKGNVSSSTDYVSRIRPFLKEIPLRNNFEYEEAFNDLNIHIFCESDLKRIHQSFWAEREEPCYQDAAADYITFEQTKEIDAKKLKEG